VNRIRYCVWMLSACTTAVATGTLGIGDVIVENNQVIVPVVLGGDVGPGVSSLNFRLQYNPAVLQPIMASAGDAAAGAEKQVLASAKQGEYIVVMMGMNQKTCSSGEVARIVLQQTGQTESSAWALGIANPTLSSSEGHVIDSEALPYTGADDDDSENEGEKPEPTKPNKPEKPSTPTVKPSGPTGVDATAGEMAAANVTPAARAGSIGEGVVRGVERMAGALADASMVRASIDSPASADDPGKPEASSPSEAARTEDGHLEISQTATGKDPAAVAEQDKIAVSQPATHPAPLQQAAAGTEPKANTKEWVIPAAAGAAFVALTGFLVMRKRLFR